MARSALIRQHAIMCRLTHTHNMPCSLPSRLTRITQVWRRFSAHTSAQTSAKFLAWRKCRRAYLKTKFAGVCPSVFLNYGAAISRRLRFATLLIMRYSVQSMTRCTQMSCGILLIKRKLIEHGWIDTSQSMTSQLIIQMNPHVRQEYM